MELDTYVSVVASLSEEFVFRFAGVRPLAMDFKLFTAPFDFPVNDVPAPLRTELVELQSNDKLTAKFHTSSPLSIAHDLRLFNTTRPCLQASTVANCSFPK